MKRLVVAVVVVACGKSSSKKQDPPPPRDEAAVVASDATERPRVEWPRIDGPSFLPAADVAKTCQAPASKLEVRVQETLGDPIEDAVGEDRTLYVGEVARTGSADNFMGIVVQARETEDHAKKLHGLSAAMYKPVTGTEMYTHRLAQNDWVRREVHGRKGRYLYNLYETDGVKEAAVCDDTELLELARLIESRLP